MEKMKRSYQYYHRYISRNLQSDLFQVDAFHKSGMSGPILGVAKYDRPLTFRFSYQTNFCTECLIIFDTNYYYLIITTYC